MSQGLPGIVGHEDTEQGKRGGKSDPGPKWDWDKFIKMVRGEVPTPDPTFPYNIGEGFRNYLKDHPEAGLPRHDEKYDHLGNAYLWLTITPTYPHGGLLMWRKYFAEKGWPAVKFISWEDMF
jgi:hypothetical protein